MKANFPDPALEIPVIGPTLPGSVQPEENPMPLDFDGQNPFRMDHCVYIYGRDGEKEVLCQNFTKTLQQMHAAAGDLRSPSPEDRKDLRLPVRSWPLDEKGEITFSTEPHDCPLPTAVPPAL
jgi:hypothetical protein